ncbi:MAG: GntR family transcriptional regulator [Acidimicrobiales bacterium]
MTDLAGVVDRSSSIPFHLQLRKLLERQIEIGQWRQGDRLPSEPFLSDHYSVSRATVRQALYALEQQGLIRKEKGRGAFVNRTSPGSWLLQWAGGLFDDELSRRGVTVESTVLRACTERLPDWAADALQLNHGSQGVTLERLRRIDGELVVYVVNYLPEEYATILPEIGNTSTASLYGTLREQHDVEVAGSSRMLEAVAASPIIGHLLDVPRRFPLVYIQSVTWDATAKPIDCFRSWLRTDRLRIAVETDTWPSPAGRVVSHSFFGVPNDDLPLA